MMCLGVYVSVSYCLYLYRSQASRTQWTYQGKTRYIGELYIHVYTCCCGEYSFVSLWMRVCVCVRVCAGPAPTTSDHSSSGPHKITDKLFANTRYFVIKSNNFENVDIAKDKVSRHQHLLS